MPFAWRFGAPPAANNPALVSSESAAGLADQAAVLVLFDTPHSARAAGTGVR